MKTAHELISIAHEYEAALIAFLQDLVRIRSVNGREGEKAVAERIAGEAQRLELPAQLIAADPDRPNVLVSWGRGEAGFALIGHMDTVAEGDPAHWTHPPFGAEIYEGRLYGRGAADNKAGIACGLYTIAVLRDQGLLDPERARILLAAVVDEESGASSTLGVRTLLDRGLLAAQGAIYTYTSDIVCVGHRGLLRLVLEARGQAIHTGSAEWSRGQGGVNAVTGLASILVNLEKLRLSAPSHPAFEGLGCTLTPGTLFRGGEFESMVPASASATVDVRLMPGQPADEVIAAIQQVIDSEIAQRPGLSVTMTIKNNVPGAAIPPDHRLVRIASRHAEAVSGHRWPVAGAGPTNEGYMLIEAGIPTLCGFGPTGGNAHAPDEWVEIASLPRTVAMYAGIIHDYLTQTREG